MCFCPELTRTRFFPLSKDADPDFPVLKKQNRSLRTCPGWSEKIKHLAGVHPNGASNNPT
jgi:hypothetical protein